MEKFALSRQDFREGMKGKGAGMSDRIYQGEDNQWYYRVRGNHAIGPFESHSEAQSKLSRQLKTWTGRSGPAAVWPRDWHPGRILRRSATRQT